MKKIDRIVVGVDRVGDRVGPTAQLAIEQALAIAKVSGARIGLLHSTRDDEHWDEDTGSFEYVAHRDDDQLRSLLDEAAAPIRAAGIPCEILVTNEPPDLAIIRHVVQTGTDLVILGKRASSDRDGRRLGSIATKVVRYCPSLVSVVKPNGHPKPKVIVAATDGGPIGTAVVTVAAQMASLCCSDLHCIHAIQIGMDVQLEGAEGRREHVSKKRDEIRATIEAEVAAAGFDGALQVHAGMTSPSKAVLEAVERLSPDLVVMGTQSRDGISGLLVGNTAERLLGILDCSLLVAKPDDFVCPLPLD